MMTIYVTDEGKFEASVRIQDGTESCGLHDTFEEAVYACFDGMQILNHAKPTELHRDDIDVVLAGKLLPLRYRLVHAASQTYLSRSNNWIADENDAAYWVHTSKLSDFVVAETNWDNNTLVGMPLNQIVIDQLNVRRDSGILLNNYVDRFIPNRPKKRAELQAELAELTKRKKELEEQLDIPFESKASTGRKRRGVRF